MRQGLTPSSDSTTRPGSCRKSPSVLYIRVGRSVTHSFPFSSPADEQPPGEAAVRGPGRSPKGAAVPSGLTAGTPAAATTTTRTGGSSAPKASNTALAQASTTPSSNAPSHCCTGAAGASAGRSATTSTKPSSALPPSSSAGDDSPTDCVRSSTRALPNHRGSASLGAWFGERGASRPPAARSRHAVRLVRLALGGMR